MSLLLAGCDTGALTNPESAIELSKGPNVPLPPQAPIAETATPTYPALAIYIVYREFVNRNPRLTSLSQDDPRYQAYMERRLIQLYPERGGYRGMMRDARAEARRNQGAFARYERDLASFEARRASFSAPLFSTASQCGDTTGIPGTGADPSWDGQDEHSVPPDEMIPTIQMEIDSLRLVGTEVDDIYYYEQLAAGTYVGEPGSGPGGPGGGSGGGGSGGYEIEQPLNAAGQALIDDLIRAAAAGHTPHSEQVVIQVNPVLIGTITLGLTAAWKIFRIKQATDRAIGRSGTFYPHQDYSNTQRDAFRHIYWSMMLRRYVGAPLTKTLTDRHENGSSGPSKAMDLHNNDIGRVHRYHAFRGHWLWDRWDHNEWALKVRSYIDNETANGEFIPEWQGENPPSEEDVLARRFCTSVYKYIFFQR